MISKRRANAVACALGAVVALACARAQAHGTDETHTHGVVPFSVAQAEAPAAERTSGQGDLVFRVFKSNRDLPREAITALINAHGGFGVDRRPGQGEIYFALPKAGIFRIAPDLSGIEAVATDPQIRDLVLHNTAVWHRDGKDFLSFPSVNGFAVYTTTFAGGLVHTLGAPVGSTYTIPAVRDYFNGKNFLVPTDLQVVDDRAYVTTGYSPLDYVLEAKIESTEPVSIAWTTDAFGGKGAEPGQLDVGHGVTLEPGGEALVIADRKNEELDRFDLEGNFLNTIALPKGTRPCDTDFLEGVMAVACLQGPDPRGAPIYLMRDGEIVSTILPKVELGLVRFQSIHNAVLIKIEGRFYIIAQAWNPGDFAIFEQVVE